jgi:hypothetical protein
MAVDFEGAVIFIDEGTDELREPTRTEAILHVVAGLTKLALLEGAELAQIIGPEAAADLAVGATRDNARALAALGVPTEEVREAIESLGG